MNRKFILHFILFAMISLIFWPGCKSTSDNNPDGEWTQEDEKGYEDLVILQKQANQTLTTYLLSQDTATALASLAQWFLSDPSVDWAEPGSQGVMVQYKSGLRGGIVIDGEDSTNTVNLWNSSSTLINQNEHDFKSIPNKKQGIFINPHYLERVTHTLSILNTYNAHVYKVLESHVTYLDTACKLDLFTTLDDYGYIHIYSHGVAWPKKQAIAEVYLMTGQKPDPLTTEKYSEQVKSGDIITMYFRGIDRTVYCISPAFIENFNDFSKDTILFYGGFCFSYQGNWPYLSDKFADGAYFGYTWRVQTAKNANWAKSLFRYMADTLAVTPWTTEKWMTATPEIPKEYFDNGDQKWVRVNYNGDAELTLWDKDSIKILIQSTETDGAPISVPGSSNTDYTFTCLVEGAEVQFLHFTWDFGDGSALQEAYQDNQMSHSWSAAGTYPLHVRVMDIDSEKLLAEATINVIVEQSISYLNQYTSNKTTYSLNYSLPSTSEISASSTGFNVYYDSLLFLAWPPAPDFTYKHSVYLKEKPLSSGESRTYTIQLTLGELTSSLPGTPSINKVTAQMWDMNGENYYEFDGLTPMIFNLATDETHTASMTVTARVWMGSGIPFELYPLEITIYKQE